VRCLTQVARFEKLDEGRGGVLGPVIDRDGGRTENALQRLNQARIQIKIGALTAATLFGAARRILGSNRAAAC